MLKCLKAVDDKLENIESLLNNFPFTIYSNRDRDNIKILIDYFLKKYPNKTLPNNIAIKLANIINIYLDTHYLFFGDSVVKGKFTDSLKKIVLPFMKTIENSPILNDFPTLKDYYEIIPKNSDKVLLTEPKKHPINKAQ